MIIVTHPNLETTYLMREHKFDRFIEINQSTWKKFNLDISKFKKVTVSVKDRELLEALNEKFPEEYL